MAMPAVQSRRWTAAEVRALPDEPGKRFECVDGELIVSPGPKWPHQRAVRALILAIHPYVVTHGIGDLLFGPGEVELDPYTLVQPDLFVAAPEELSARWDTVKTLLLAIEVLSPRSGRADRVLKRGAYQENRVATYWIVDHEAELMEVWRPDDARPLVVTDALAWRVRPDAPELRLELATLWEGLP